MTLNWVVLPKEFNATVLKGWSIVWLWIGTGVIWGLVAGYCALTGKLAPVEWLVTWLGGLTAYSAVGAYSAKNFRETDYEFARIKAGANVPASVTTVQPGAVNVAAAQEVVK